MAHCLLMPQQVEHGYEGRWRFGKKVESSSGTSHNKGDLLMVGRLMNAQVNENIFHSRCHVKGNICCIFIYGGSSVNMASLRLEEKLNLPTLVYLRPYKLKVTHDGATNIFAFVHMEQKVTLKPLSPRKPLYLLPTYICFHISFPLIVLPTRFREMLESFKDLFPKDIPKGFPSIRGIEHHIDFTLGATLPNMATYKVNPEENKEIQQVGKLVEKGWIHES
ncbi:hypothetical protein CR513_21985, partial [Mucuna pruriens]